MSTFKRSISSLLVLGILLGVLAPAAQAAPVEETATVDTGDVTIEGTNGFGDLLAQEITENQQENVTENEGYPSGYSVTDLEIADGVATVTYDSMEDATLVVALHTEDGMQLLTSATVTVTPDATETTVTFEGEMPEYFMASAYLLDQYDYSPLCDSYDTPMYTREMQELLASTVDDYDPDKILNLDDNETTNFAVYADSTIVIVPTEGFNTVASIDDESMIYVINNADKQMTDLAEGDVVVYPYGEDEILIVKVASITVEGTTVTITGADLTVEEVFSHVKVESDSSTEEMTVIEGTGDEGVTYVGLTEGSDAVTPNAVEGGVTAKLYHEFRFSKLFPEDLPGNGGNKDDDKENTKEIKADGTLKLGVQFEFDYYVSWTRRYVKFSVATGVEVNIGITGQLKQKVLKLQEFGVSPIVGVYIGIEPKVEFQASGELAWVGSFSFTLGFAYSNDKGGENLTTAPKLKSDIKLEGTLFFGVDLHPTIEVIGGTVVDVDLKGLIGLELNGKLAGTQVEHDDENISHGCEECIQGDVQFKAAVSAEIQFLKYKDFTVDLDIFEANFKLFDYYFSLTHGTIGLKTCPYTHYKIIFEVRNGIHLPMKDTEILRADGTALGKTNERGVLIAWLPIGKTTVKATVFGEELEETVEVTEDKAGSKVLLQFGVSVSAKDYLTSAKEAVDNSSITSGTCGSNAYWTLYASGLLEISGSGNMADYNPGSTPWYSYREDIYSIKIADGITGIGMYAFCECANLESVTIAPSVTKIGDASFGYCTGLEEIVIPEGTKIIGMSAFDYCRKLKTAYLPVSLTYIDMFAFYLSGLKDVYYAGSEEQWGKISIGSFSGIGSATLHFNSSYVVINLLAPNAVYPGDYDTEITDGVAIKTASFSNLVPNEQYVLLAMVSIEADAPLAAENLLAIDQEAASEDGTLSFRYIQRTSYDISYVVACGASNKNLNDAVITFPETTEDSELRVVNPTVEYDGKTLTEGLDYIITGTVAYTEPGEYTCYIRGIYNYTGLVECIYTVNSHEHIFTNYISDGNATCTQDGTKTAKCDHCDRTDTIADVGSALGHNMGAWNTVRSATCTENGEEQRNCTRCDHSESRTIEAVGHRWDNGVVTREPTEETEGERLYTCTACGATRTETIPVIGHEHSYEAIVTAPTCTEQGYTTYTCRCGESYTADYVDALGHAWGDWIVIQEPTTTENGVEEHTCTRCGHAEQRSIAKLENPFNDVAPGSFFYEPVMWAIENGITNGTSATTFGPNDQCMRAHVVTFLWRAVGSPEPTRTDNPFVDVKPSDFYYKPVLWALENGITSGMDATHFGPTAYCNRAQVVTFLYRTMGSPELESAENPFTDVAKGSFYEKPVLWAVKNGITNGLSATTFGPSTICNRAQIVTFLYRAFVD